MGVSRVYRLDVSFWPYGSHGKPRTWVIFAPSMPPEIRDDPNYGPEAWSEYQTEYRYPRIRKYLSEDGAENRASHFRRLGCRVTIEKSEPVEWNGS